MKNKLFIFFILSTILLPLYGQTTNLKEDAIKVAEKGNYTKAIELLEKAKTESPNDPEIYYYLGVFMHYLSYDSVPLVGYNSSYPDKVLVNLEKTIKLKPDYGNAYYFIGAQYGANAIDALLDGNEEEYKIAFKKAYDAGAFPVWLIEYDRNILKSCPENAILFVTGDAVFDPIQYLQEIENYRKDVTVIAFPFLNRPWYVNILKNGFNDVITKIPIRISSKQIMDIHPYKWDTLEVNIPISEKLKNEFNLPIDAIMKWSLEPDMDSNNRSLLSTNLTILLNIIESNKWERPIFFSLGFMPSTFSGLEKNFQLYGMAFRLLPFKTEKTNYNINVSKIEEVLLNKNNIKDFKEVNKHNMPRASNMLGNYYWVLYNLADYYKSKNQLDKIRQLENYIKEYLNTDTLQYGNKILQMIDKLAKN